MLTSDILICNKIFSTKIRGTMI
uniref:Uncharacterized protein n=1 Tax=Arundo donax TaxID=35708 RepID=A0A0A9BFH2_ARUDO